MSSFYARYVPPPKSAPTTERPAHLNGSTKRKRPEQEITIRESKKQRSSPATESKTNGFTITGSVQEQHKRSYDHEDKTPAESVRERSQVERINSGGRGILDKYKVTGAAKKNGDAVDIQIRRPMKNRGASDEKVDSIKLSKEPKPKKSKRTRIDDVHEREEVLEVAKDATERDERSSEDGFEKHLAVRERFRKAKRKSEQYQDEQPADDTQDTTKPELHGLEPLPQPPEVAQPYELPSYSTLPSWMAQADHISRDAETPFASLELGDTALANLTAKGFVKAMPIQSAVIPLLSNGLSRHDGDLAVAAATGSGKTLAYVLPMVEALKDLAVTKLRGLIVVPTRELVKQVQETFVTCAEGTKLRAATALGSRSVKEEAEAFIESYQVYDPDAYAEQQSTKVDWAEFSLIELFDRVQEGARQAPNHVTKHRSKVDILICTPGRLVEHLQTSRGFSLDDVQWLVIDEVDRLLNESYQEWLEVVMPALRSRRATESRDMVLQSMGLALPARKIQKVILSATMTQDLSKLNSLSLRNPRLLTLDGEQTERTKKQADVEETSEPIQDATGAFQLPNTLIETTVLVGDGSEKPLHLLELLHTRIVKAKQQVTNGATPQAPDDSSSDSSDDTSSSESDSVSDSDSGSSASSLPAGTNGVKEARVLSSKSPSTLIFTRSTESAPRLSRLLSLLDPSLASTTAVLTRSTTSSASSRRALKSFRSGAISILITTDRAARGLDIPNIEHVINYDVPSSVQFYVHRVGRTARAGKQGKAWTLVAHREGRWFDGEIAKGTQVRRNGKVSKITLGSVGQNAETKKKYEEALKQIGEEVEGK